MASSHVIYAESRTLHRFHESDDFVRCIVGPVGSGKSTGCVMEGYLRARGQVPGPDGVRRSRGAIIRNTYSQLRDTTRRTFEQWIPPGLGKWHEQSFTWTGQWKYEGHPVHTEILFRALDRPEDIKKLLSLELTWAYINEAREVPKNVLDILETRVGRYPSQAQGGPTWFGIWMDTNPWHSGHWGSKLFAKSLDGYRLFRQPGGRSPGAENTGNLPAGYYERLSRGKDREWIRVYVDGEDASGDTGAVFGAWIDAAVREGRVTDFTHPYTEVFTTWDLGKRDSTAIWFWRKEGSAVEIVDHYENAGQHLGHYFEVIEAKPYKYAFHWLPHDARAETLSTDQTVVERFVDRYGIEKVGVVPKMGVDDSIDAGRWLLEQPTTRVHSRCDTQRRLEYSGLDALRGYRFEWDEKDQCFSKDPMHNWASHTGDAFRYIASVLKHSGLMLEKPKQAEPPKVRTLNSFNLDELFEARERELRR